MSERLFLSEAVGSEPRLRFLPVMIARLMLSLKKAATPGAWTFGEPSMRFAEPRYSVATRDEVRLETFASGLGGSETGRAV